MTDINWNYLVLDKPVHMVSLSLSFGSQVHFWQILKTDANLRDLERGLSLFTVPLVHLFLTQKGHTSLLPFCESWDQVSSCI